MTRNDGSAHRWHCDGTQPAALALADEGREIDRKHTWQRL
jgi:hypothetical protein